MAVPPAETCEQHIAGLRSALQRMVPLLSFHAGREAADSDPEQSALLLRAAADLEGILARAAPQRQPEAGTAGPVTTWWSPASSPSRPGRPGRPHAQSCPAAPSAGPRPPSRTPSPRSARARRRAAAWKAAAWRRRSTRTCSTGAGASVATKSASGKRYGATPASRRSVSPPPPRTAWRTGPSNRSDPCTTARRYQCILMPGLCSGQPLAKSDLTPCSCTNGLGNFTESLGSAYAVSTCTRRAATSGFLGQPCKANKWT